MVLIADEISLSPPDTAARPGRETHMSPWVQQVTKTIIIAHQKTTKFKFQVSHVYFMKYSMMGLLHMPNIMSSIEADPYSTYHDILSH